MADMDQSSGDEVDRDDPLLITTVRARLKREEKVKKVGRKTVKKLVSIEGGDEDKAGEKEEEQPSMVNPRRYQEEAFQEALRKNIILCLGTGGGKTLVAVLLMKALAKNTRLETDKRLIVFLAPTVLLVQQQARVVKIHTDLKVGEFYGAKGVDHWSSTEWENQISEFEVMMMTPQVLLNNLQHGFMKMDIIELLIFDECHHAHKNHAYAQIMKGFYHVNAEKGRLPKIFGMTASPVIKKGVKSHSEAAVQISVLEDVLKAEVFTLKDTGREEVELVAPTASTIEQLYDAPNLEAIAPYKVTMEALLAKYEKANMETLASMKVGFKDHAELIDKLTEKIKKLHRDLQFCLEELGLWCAYKAAEHTFNVDTAVNDFEGLGDATQNFKRNKDLFLKESLQILQSAVPEGWNTAPTVRELQAGVNKGYLTPKVYQLVVILFQKRSKKDVKCIIFVERRTAARVLANLVNHLECLSEFLQARSICGANAGVDTTRVQQQSTVAEFNQGQVNLLVATDVAEEGIDVQTCSEVIRFSLPKTVRSNIQSRGRARRHGSTYIVFLERGNISQKDQFSRILESEPVMNKEVISRENMPVNCNLSVRPPPDSYRVEKTGASVTTETSVKLIIRFCQKLPGDKYYTPKPEFLVREVDSQYRCVLKLPHPSPISEVQGEVQSTFLLAKQATALEACRKLHKEGALNDNLVPSFDYELDDEEAKKISKLGNASGLGTTQQKELYPAQEAEALTGSWLSRNSDAHLHAYRLSFDVQPVEDEVHADFVLLTGNALDDDVATLGTDLLLTRGRKVTAKLSPLGITTVTAHRLGDAKIFQQVLFNGMFSKMSKSAQEGRKRKRGSGISSLFIDREDLWKSNNAYLLLPAALKETSDLDSSIPIDWKSIQATSSAVKNLEQNENEDEDSENCQPRKKYSIFKALSQLFSPRQEKPLENGLTCAGYRQLPNSQRQGKSVENFLTFAGNRPVSISQVADVAVLTRHTMMIYPVLGVLYDRTALSHFPRENDSEFKSYAEFFKMKYGIELRWPNQPLLQLKQNHRAHNLLPTDPGKSGGPAGVKKKKKFQKTSASEQRNDVENVDSAPNELKNPAKKVAKPVVSKASVQSTSVEMPPELCLELGFSAAVIRSAYWVPSIMHRIKTAVLASELRRSIHAPKIPVMEVLKALTTTRCNEIFNMEALELFGDSFLKYAVSRKLFLELKTVNEGVLSTRRMHRICNRTLHQLAVKRGLPAYIRDCQFDPSRWVAPGMVVSKEIKCRCKEKQMFKPFISTTSKVIGVFGNEILKDTVQTETIKPKIGLTCDKGHRYLCSKTVADVVEALIGAYLDFGKNCEGALKFMVWTGIDVDYDPHLMKAASEESPVDLSCDYGMDVKALEKRIGYTFKNKYLLLEAMTHTSNMGGDRVRCYQRLEFLGDAVLDFLLTRHLFTSHPTSTPGLLTSLRSASVNNERFARVAVKLRLHCYLRHGSGMLFEQIQRFAMSFEAASDDQKNSSFGLNGLEAPKVLGDLVESIAGAILLDTCFDLDKVWAVMMPLLEPIVTPDTLDLHPVTDLEELCAREGFNLNFYDQHSKDKRTSTVKYEIHINDEICVDGISCQLKKKIAKKDAAWKVLSKLKTHGFKEKFGTRIKCEDSNELASLQISDTSQIRQEEKVEDSTFLLHRNKCEEKVAKETCNIEPKLEPSEVFGNIPSADTLQSFPDLPTSIPVTIDNGSDEGVHERQDSVVTMSKVERVIETDAEELISTAKSKSSSLLLNSCTRVTISGNGCYPKVNDRSENENIQDGVKEGVEVNRQVESVVVTRQVESVVVTRQGEGVVVKRQSEGVVLKRQAEGVEATQQVEGEDSVELPGNVSKIVQGKVLDDVQLPAVKDLPRVDTRTGGEESSRGAASKRKFVSENEDGKISSKSSKFYWSQDVTIQNVEITLSPNTELHFKRPNFVKPTDEANDLLKFCPWTGAFSPVIPVPVMNPKSSVSTTFQGTRSNPKAGKNAPPTNCRQILNELFMKNKWSTRPKYELMDDESMSHLRSAMCRFRFSLTVDTGKEKYESQGESKTDKKQGQESAAEAMLTILGKNGITGSGLP
ncbi:hypothetical protein KC19_12G024900 [Ceratodon purpureus]|uniref:Uncharacterized protein n=1 Tax=Ceratodon purpureus TaxID=3225 RepID=A0A8T0G584_CERPU|nr:hypothetical protein KC19_12G024900 [Ceratodon purpureus]